MIFYTICEMIENKFGKNYKALCAGLDENFGCLDAKEEERLQQMFKSIKRVDNFNKYYQWVKRDCPDGNALALRLRQAVTNSKAKKYHGSSEHMNELPKMEEQATNFLMQEPSPFSFCTNEAKNEFLDENDPKWKVAVCKKFDWIAVLLKNHTSNHTPCSLALQSDEQNLHER